MKCVCGYEHQVENKDKNQKSVGSEKFNELDIDATIIHRYGRHEPDYYQCACLYACPECGAVKVVI